MSGDVVPIRTSLFPQSRSVEKAREDGYTCLTPLERQVAIEFATSGCTLKEVARILGQPLGDVKHAFKDPVVRAFIHDLQMEIAAHKIINAAWVEQQVLEIWPQLRGLESVHLINKSGEQIVAKKFHAPEVASILKHFSGNADQKKAGGVQVTINFGDMGVSPPKPHIEASVITREIGKSDAEDA